MNTLIVLCAVTTIAMAELLGEQRVSVSQDSLGSYDVKYATHTLSRAEHRDITGRVNGGYSYIDPYGILRKVTYAAGEDGFHAISNDIPLPVPDTPEVAAARAEHLAKLRTAETTQTPIELPKVAAAKPLQFAPGSLVRIAPIPVPLVRLVPGPETPEILEAEGKQFAAIVDQTKHIEVKE